MPAAVLRPGTLAVDLMYGAAAAPFMAWARAHGAVPRDGLGMLVEQAAEAFFLCREDIRVKGAGGTSSLHALYDWGATVTLVTHAAAAKAGLERRMQVKAAVAGLGGCCTAVDSCYSLRDQTKLNMENVIKC